MGIVKTVKSNLLSSFQPKSPTSVLRLILHSPNPLIHIATRRPSPSSTRLLPTLHLPLVLHRHTTTATAPLQKVAPNTPSNLIRMSDPRALEHRKQPPESTAQTHHHAVPVRRRVAQHIGRVFLCRFLRQAVGCAAVDDARAEEAGETCGWIRGAGTE